MSSIFTLVGAVILCAVGGFLFGLLLYILTKKEKPPRHNRRLSDRFPFSDDITTIG